MLSHCEAPSEAAIVLCILKMKVSGHILPQDASSCVDGDGETGVIKVSIISEPVPVSQLQRHTSISVFVIGSF